MVRPCLRWLTDGLEQVAVQQGASPCWAVILFVGFDASLKVQLTDRSEFLVNHDALQLNMKILGNFFKGYCMPEFWDGTQRFVTASET